MPLNRKRYPLWNKILAASMALICLSSCSDEPAGPPPSDAAGGIDPIAEGRAFLLQGDPTTALSKFTAALEAGKEPAQARLGRGKSFLALGRTAEAIADLMEAAKLAPSDGKVLHQLGVARARSRDPAGAVEAYTRAIEADPDFAEPLIDRSAALFELGRAREAIADCDAALRLNPLDAPALVNRGIFRSRFGDRAGALADWNEAIRAQPSFPGGWYSRGVDHGMRGEYRKAVADLTRAVELEPSHAAARQSRAMARAALGEHEGAVEDLTEVIRSHPGAAEAYKLRAASLRQLGRSEEADADERRAGGLETEKR